MLDPRPRSATGESASPSTIRSAGDGGHKLPQNAETGWETLGEEIQTHRRPSPSSPGSSRQKANPSNLSSGERERRRHSSRMKAGPSSPKSPGESSARQRAKTSDGTSNKGRLLPLGRKSDDSGHVASPNDLGVVDFSMEGMQLDVSMDDILDPSAAPRGRDSTAGQQAGANIAPWLMDDSTPSPSGSQTPAQGYEPSQADGLAPKLNRLTSDRSIRTTYTARNGSQPSIVGMPVDGDQRSRQGSGDSIQTLAAARPKPAKNNDVVPGGGRHSIAGRAGRFGSTASSASAGTGEKKKGGFLGGLLKRKATGMSLGSSCLIMLWYTLISAGPLTDFNPGEAHRPSQSGSSSSRISSSNSFGSMSHAANTTNALAEEGPSPGGPFDQQYYSGLYDGMISPLHEIAEPEFTLDMNLDDMEGIVDPNLANAPPTTVPSRHPTLANSSISDSTSGWGLQDALLEPNQRSEGSSGSASSSQPSSRDVFAESAYPAVNPFTKQNPFAARSSNGSDDVKPNTPTSPHTYSPKHSLPAPSAPRRPSQLRNVKMGSIDSQDSESSSSRGGTSLQPSWASNMNSRQPTVFNDPFKSSQPTISTPAPDPAGDRARQDSMTPHAPINDGGLLAPAIVGPGPAWAAPESWGVEGDEEEDDPHDESSSSSIEGEEEWTVADSPASPGTGLERRESLMLPPLDGRKPPPFGFKSRGATNGARPGSSSRGARTKTRDGRPSTSARTTTSNRPGTSGSAHLVSVPVSTCRCWYRMSLMSST
jgi:adenylate cyclase